MPAWRSSLTMPVWVRLRRGGRTRPLSGAGRGGRRWSLVMRTRCRVRSNTALVTGPTRGHRVELALQRPGFLIEGAGPGGDEAQRGFRRLDRIGRVLQVDLRSIAL